MTSSTLAKKLATARRPAALAALGVLACLVAACATTASSGSGPQIGPQASATTPAPGSPAATSAPASSTPAQATTASCLSTDLQPQLGSAQGTAGTFYQVIVLTNTSAGPCSLYGFPGVSFVTGVGGTQIGAPATRMPGKTASTVTLAPGAKANLLLAIHDAGAYSPSACDQTSADWLRIYPPGDYGAVYVQYQAQACAKASLSIMQVSPVSAGTGGAS